MRQTAGTRRGLAQTWLQPPTSPPSWEHGSLAILSFHVPAPSGSVLVAVVVRIPPGKTLHLDTGSGSSPHELGPDHVLGSVIGMLTSEAAARGVGRLPTSARQVIGHCVNLPSVSCFWEENWLLRVKPNTFRSSAPFRSSFAPHTSYCNVLLSPSSLRLPIFVSVLSLHTLRPSLFPSSFFPFSPSINASLLSSVAPTLLLLLFFSTCICCESEWAPAGICGYYLKKIFFHSSSPLHVFPATAHHPLSLNLLPGAKKQHGIRETCTRHARCDYGPYPS